MDNALKLIVCCIASLLLAGLYSAVFCLVVWHLAIGLTAAGHHMVYWCHAASPSVGVGPASLACLGIFIGVSGQVSAS